MDAPMHFHKKYTGNKHICKLSLILQLQATVAVRDFMLYRFTIKFLILTVLYAVGNPVMSASEPDARTNEALLLRLDSAISVQQALVNKKENLISGIKNNLENLSVPDERLGAVRRLYDEYLVYNSDSALHYAGMAFDIVKQNYPDNPRLEQEWLLNIAACNIAQGLFSEGLSILNNIKSTQLTPRLKGKYFNTLANAHILQALYLKDKTGNKDLEMAKSLPYLDSLMTLNRTNPEYAWVPVAYCLGQGNNDIGHKEVSWLKETVDSRKDYSRDNAINAYWLARYYNTVGDNDNMLNYMARAAINDAMIVNRDVAAIQTLAFHAFENGQIERAYNYLSYAIEQANSYHTRHRIVNMSELSSTIRDAYKYELEKRDIRLRWFAGALGILAVLLIGCMVLILIENRKLNQTRKNLSQTNRALQQSIRDHNNTILNLEAVNTRLSEANRQLKDMNAQLQETNKQKLGVLGYAFKLTSKFVEEIENYRKKLLRKYKTKEFNELGVLINDPELIKDQYKAFYEGFDHLTLSLFPNLPEEYNARVTDDLKVSPENIAKTKSLNTRLRIYALKRLGVSKSVDIASMLNVSIRTVYNNKGNSTASEDL